jgi:hypothetical protein
VPGLPFAYWVSERSRQWLEAEKAKAKQEGKTKLTRAINVPSAITEASQLDTLIQELQALRHELALYSRVNLDLWYPGPPRKGGHPYGNVTLCRSADPPDRGARFDQSHGARVSAVGSPL